MPLHKVGLYSFQYGDFNETHTQYNVVDISCTQFN